MPDEGKWPALHVARVQVGRNYFYAIAHYPERARERGEDTRRYLPASLVEPLVEALTEAIQFGDEGWAYATPYFREKWNYKGERAKLLAALANFKAATEGSSDE